MAAQLPGAKMPSTALRVMGDDRLFRLAASGDSRAFELLYERHYQAIYRYCRSIVGNPEDAADALQSTMASALRAIVGEQRDIPVRPWLFRIAHNESVSLLRKRRPHAAIDVALEIEAPTHDPAVKQRLADLVRDLRQLPDAQRGALVMHELSGLPYREIGSALEVTEAHARQLVYEARTALHDLAEGRDMECDQVRRTISDGDRRVLRGRRIRSHLRTCSRCAGFEQVLSTRRRDLAAIAPPLPAAAAAGLLHKLLGGAGSGSGGAAAASSSGAAGFSSAVGGKALVASGVSKLVAVAAVTVAAGAGAVEVARTTSHSHGGPGVSAHSSAAASHAAKAGAVVTPSVTTKPVSAPGASGSAPGNQQAAKAHTQHGAEGGGSGSVSHPAHPAHPAHPTHPTHPTHPAHPTHPSNPGNSSHTSHPSHPAHPTHPTPPITPAQPTRPTHPSHPTTPGAGQQNSSTHDNPHALTTPVIPTTPVVTAPPAGQGNASGNSNGSANGNGNKGVLGTIP